jgi:glycerate 2-kinase
MLPLLLRASLLPLLMPTQGLVPNSIVLRCRCRSWTGRAGWGAADTSTKPRHASMVPFRSSARHVPPSMLLRSHPCRAAFAAASAASPSLSLRNVVAQRQRRRQNQPALLLAARALTEAEDHPSASFRRSNSTEGAARTDREVQMGDDALRMIRSAIRAVDPFGAVTSKLRLQVEEEQVASSSSSSSSSANAQHSKRRVLLSFDNGAQTYNVSEDYDRIVLVGFGKASAAMAAGVLSVLDPPPSNVSSPNDTTASTLLRKATLLRKDMITGLLIVKDGHATPEQVELLRSHNVQVREASHPVPDERSVKSSTELLDLVRTSCATHKDRTLVICCISGGGSSLFCAPVPPLTLGDLQRTNRVLLQSGWDIRDMNTVRKQLEMGKGGRLATAAFPGHVVSLVLSDVIGDPLDLIASGPTTPNPTTASDAWNLIQQRGFPPNLQLPSPVLEMLKAKADGTSLEGNDDDAQPTADHPVFRTSHNCLVGNNAAAVQAAADQAVVLGYHPVILATQMTGEASQVAPLLVAMAHQLQVDSAHPSAHPMVRQLPAALILGGETTVTLPPDCAGKGGRNQELALQAASSMHGMRLRNVVVASVGTDGGDGPTDAAGAVVDGGTVERLGVRDAHAALKEHDAYHYLSRKDSRGWSPLLKVC